MMVSAPEAEPSRARCSHLFVFFVYIKYSLSLCHSAVGCHLPPTSVLVEFYVILHIRLSQYAIRFAGGLSLAKLVAAGGLRFLYVIKYLVAPSLDARRGWSSTTLKCKTVSCGLSALASPGVCGRACKRVGSRSPIPDIWTIQATGRAMVARGMLLAADWVWRLRCPEQLWLISISMCLSLHLPRIVDDGDDRLCVPLPFSVDKFDVHAGWCTAGLVIMIGAQAVLEAYYICVGWGS